MIPFGLIAASLVLATPGVEAPPEGVAVFLDDASGGRAPAECVKGALPRLRGQMSRDGRVRLVKNREEATVAVDVRECGFRWETKTSGEVGVGVTLGGTGSSPSATGGKATGTVTQSGVGVRRQQSGYLILRARSQDRAPEFTSLPHTEVFPDAVAVTGEMLLEWIGGHAEELRAPREVAAGHQGPPAVPLLP